MKYRTQGSRGKRSSNDYHAEIEIHASNFRIPVDDSRCLVYIIVDDLSARAWSFVNQVEPCNEETRWYCFLEISYIVARYRRMIPPWWTVENLRRLFVGRGFGGSWKVKAGCNGFRTLVEDSGIERLEDTERFLRKVEDCKFMDGNLLVNIRWK